MASESGQDLPIIEVRVFAEAGAVEDGVIEQFKADVESGIRKYVERARSRAALVGNFIPVEELLNTVYNPKVRPFLPRRLK